MIKLLIVKSMLCASLIGYLFISCINGIRQDFVITSRPEGKGTLVLELAVEGAAGDCRFYADGHF
jgi:hypothetical protein